MESCICGKKSKTLTITKDEVVGTYVFLAIILAIGAIFMWQVVVAAAVFILFVIIILAIARIIARHKIRCATVWGVSYIARILQYVDLIQLFSLSIIKRLGARYRTLRTPQSY